MKKWWFLSLLLLLPALASAATVKISNKTSLSFKVPQGWELATEPPTTLVADLAEHLGHDATDKGYSPSKDQLLDAARKRLRANEAILYNPQSKCYLTLDLSPMRQGEHPPSEETIRLSAKYAGESLQHEAGISSLTSSSREATISGGWYSYRYDADYLHEGQKMHFSGVIGFAAPYWYFFYYTDFLKDPADSGRAEQVFTSIKLEIKQ